MPRSQCRRFDLFSTVNVKSLMTNNITCSNGHLLYIQNQIILVTAFLGLSSAFLLVDNCPVSSPCTCSGSSGSYSYIRCGSKSLTNIPNIKQSSSHVNKLYLYFYSNKISVIQNNAFRNFSSINASEIDLQLYSNMIHSIESNAFNGIANTTTSLDLHNNNLTILPSAILNLFNLRTLNVLGNPLHSLDKLIHHQCQI
ncbi:uncharacterized protein LOC132755514 [Ruditapes philippinarum]|uniref:uncharacterized protein LOC132755514 n=1 Tax=Ruditapes philippinarum TaxID=129788 RepID=UPI00295BED76|nr:uncharacterized protein LOC132755514 [Ruditapes philippinarum]